MLPRPQIPGSRLIDGELLGDCGKELSNILAGLGRGLEEEQAGFAGILLGIGRGNGPFVGRLGDQVELVAGQCDDDVLVGLALELLDPGFGLIEGCLSVLVVVGGQGQAANIQPA